jgi:hypothetical protein
MKRLLVSFALALCATAALAQAVDRDVLVTPDGTVFTVETQTPSPDSSMDAMSTLVLTIQNGSNVSHVSVPDSTSAGFHFSGALAYDPDSGTLFVLWLHAPNAMSSELLLAPYRDGKWQPAVSVDNEGYRLRSNLRLGITRHVSQLLADGSSADAPALLLHAVWWEESGQGQEARYALLAIDKGALSSIDTHALGEFVDPTTNGYNAVDPTFNKEILRHPAIVSSPMQSTVNIIFGDASSNAIHGVTLTPVIDLHPQAEHRIHIPVGIGGGNGAGGGRALNIVAPPTFSADWTGPITIIERGDRLAFANVGATSLNYITYTNGAWTGVKSIAIDSKFPAEAALAALDKMVSTQ